VAPGAIADLKPGHAYSQMQRTWRSREIARVRFRAASGFETLGHRCTSITWGYTRAQNDIEVTHNGGILLITFSIRASTRDRDQYQCRSAYAL